MSDSIKNVKFICHTFHVNVSGWKEAADLLVQSSNLNTKERWEISPKLTVKTPERRHWRLSGVFIVNFEHISRILQAFSLLTLNKWISVDVYSCC